MKTRGFSLVELLIAIVIAVLLLALALPNFSSMLRNAKIRNLAGSIVNGLNVAKAEAVQRNKLVSFELPVNGSGWFVSEFASPNTPPNPVIQAQDSGNVDNLNLVLTVVSGNSRVVLTTGSGVVTFNSLGRLAVNSPRMEFDVVSTVGGACATQMNPNGTRCLRIEVSSGGQVRMCDPASQNDDVQACQNPRTGV